PSPTPRSWAGSAVGPSARSRSPTDPAAAVLADRLYANAPPGLRRRTAAAAPGWMRAENADLAPNGRRPSRPRFPTDREWSNAGRRRGGRVPAARAEAAVPGRPAMTPAGREVGLLEALLELGQGGF